MPLSNNQIHSSSGARNTKRRMASMLERSAELTAQDAADSAFKQVTFSGESPCELFVPNPFKKDVCRECMSKIITHHRAAVEKEKDVRAAVEFLCKAPSTIVAAEAGG